MIPTHMPITVANRTAMKATNSVRAVFSVRDMSRMVAKRAGQDDGLLGEFAT